MFQSDKYVKYTLTIIIIKHVNITFNLTKKYK